MYVDENSTATSEPITAASSAPNIDFSSRFVPADACSGPHEASLHLGHVFLNQTSLCKTPVHGQRSHAVITGI